MNSLLEIYILVFGFISIIMGLIEYAAPERTLKFWDHWSSSPYYRFHGLFLIITGFPLTVAKGQLSTPLFLAGIFFVLTGPFVLIYPEKFSKNYNIILEEKGKSGIDKLIIFDALLKTIVGIICILHYFLNNY